MKVQDYEVLIGPLSPGGGGREMGIVVAGKPLELGAHAVAGRGELLAHEVGVLFEEPRILLL